MVDFRYHALSLVAVFLALGIGIVLGVTIGDSLVSDADRNLRDSLRGDVTEAREDADREQALGERREDVIEDLLPQATRGELRGRRVALVALGEMPGEVEDGFEDAVLRAGGSIHSKTILDVPEDLDALGRYVPARRALRRRIVPRGGDTDAARLGGRIGRSIVLGSPGLRRLRSELPDDFKGRYRGQAEGVVIYRHPPPDVAPEQEDAAELRGTFDEGVLEGLSFGQPLVGAELAATDPSQVGWYDDRDVIVGSVDNLDTAEGELALVYVLANPGNDSVEGAFGTKESADRVIPDLSD